jgi:hypothetical protein
VISSLSPVTLKTMKLVCAASLLGMQYEGLSVQRKTGWLRNRDKASEWNDKFEPRIVNSLS